MKKIISLTLALCMSLISCDEEEAGTLSIDLLLDRIEANTILLDQAYGEATVLLDDNEKIQKVLEGAKTKSEFINSMNTLVKGAFNIAIDKSRTSLILGDAQYPESDLSQTHFLKHILSTEDTKADPLVAYALEIENNIQTKKPDNLIFIESYSLNQGASLPTEKITITYEHIEVMLDIFDLVMEHTDPVVLDKAIETYIKSNNPPPVPIGMLVPAIQHIREAARQHKELLELAFGEFGDKTGNAAFIQRQRAAGFLGGLHLMVSDDFRNDDENFASIGVIRQVYMASLTEMWNQLWELNQ